MDTVLLKSINVLNGMINMQAKERHASGEGPQPPARLQKKLLKKVAFLESKP